MSDFKFICPACGQHLSCDEGHAGLQITCPTCEQPITVPAAPLAAAVPAAARPPTVRLSRAAPAPPPIPASIAPPTPNLRTPAKRCGLAVASLICSCIGLVFGFLGTIPGIVCGHLALGRIKRTPGLGGKGLATARLITGYTLSLIWIPLAYILVVATISGFRAAARTQARLGELQSVTNNFAANDVAADLNPDGSGWTPDLESAAIPDAPVSGRIQGLPFKAEQVELDTFGIEFSQGMSPGAALDAFRNLSLRFDEPDIRKYSGQTFVVTKDASGSVQPNADPRFKAPNVRMCWVEPGEKRPRDSMLNEYRYAMRLEFGPLKADKLPGRIYLCVLDRKKSFIRGKFVAHVDNNLLAGRQSPQLLGFNRPEEGLPLDTAPDAAGWTLELENAAIPDAPATGRVHGVAFKLERVETQGPLLHLRQGSGFFADREFRLLFWDTGNDLSKLSGRTIVVNQNDFGAGKPHLMMQWMARGGQVPEMETVDKYVMRLEFGELKGGRLPGRIYLCVLDREKSFVRGKFVANVQGLPSGPGPVPQRPRGFSTPAPPGGQRMGPRSGR